MKTKKTIFHLFFITIIFIFVTAVSFAQTTQTYYCAANSEFVTDLDVLLDPATCEAAGFTHTGQFCCGEPEDVNEHYNDVDGIGGCFNKEFIASGTLIPNRVDIINFEGVFLGCNINDNDAVLSITDTHNTNLQLIDNVNHCFQDTNNLIFCSFNNSWQFSNGIERPHLNLLPPELQSGVNQIGECCQIDKCWNGTTCVGNQRNEISSEPFQGFRCIDGDWSRSTLLFTPDGRDNGFCPDPDQCLFDINGDSQDNNNPDGRPQCISNGQFKNDDYCENGNWTSRTKFVALQFIQIAGANDHIILCDTAENTLNNLNYQIQGQLALTLVTSDKTNNFCTLIINDDVLIGTSFNKPITDPDIISFLQSIGVDNCNTAALNTDGQYHPCNNNKAWYNLRLNSIIYSDETFNIGPANFFEIFINFLRNPFRTIINIISGTVDLVPAPIFFVDSLDKFERLYLSKTANKEIRGSIEGKDFKNLVIEYVNFDTDICDSIDEFNHQRTSDSFSGVECSRENPSCTTSCNYYVVAQGSSSTNLNPDDIWNDLTSKLRVS